MQISRKALARFPTTSFIESALVAGEKRALVDFSPFPDGNYLARNLTLTDAQGLDRNPHYRHSLRFLSPGSTLTMVTRIPQAGYVLMELEHLSSASSQCPGGGYSPVTITINGQTFRRGFSPSQRHYIKDVFNITDSVREGDNTITFTADRDLCTHYWLKELALYW